MIEKGWPADFQAGCLYVRNGYPYCEDDSFILVLHVYPRHRESDATGLVTYVSQQGMCTARLDSFVWRPFEPW